MGIRVLYGTVAHLTLETFAFVQKIVYRDCYRDIFIFGFCSFKKMFWKRWGTLYSICRPKPALATNLQVLRTAPILWPFLWSQFHHNFLSCAVKEVVRKAPPSFVQADSNFRVGSSSLDRTFFSFGPFLQSLAGYKAEKGPDSPVRVKAPPQALAFEVCLSVSRISRHAKDIPYMHLHTHWSLTFVREKVFLKSFVPFEPFVDCCRL